MIATFPQHSLRQAFLAAALLPVFGAPTFGQAVSPGEQPDMTGARPLKAWQVEQLFAGKTWLWQSGAAYYAKAPRAFSAYVDSNGKPVVGSGRWMILDGGQLCSDAKWETTVSADHAVNCYSHRELNNIIYQKQEPNGQWYRLGSPDEVSRAIVAGDRVSSKFKELKESIAKGR